MVCTGKQRFVVSRVSSSVKHFFLGGGGGGGGRARRGGGWCGGGKRNKWVGIYSTLTLRGPWDMFWGNFLMPLGNS